VNHQGHRFVVATLGQTYMIRVSNPTSQKIEAVITVDARDVLTGKKSDPQARGYLIHPNSHYDVKGFRVSDTEVDTFTFSAKEDSYAAKWKDDKNIGIIGAIFYKKRPRGYAMAEETQELGTADGHRQVSKVVYRSFHRGERFERPSIFYYDSRESLERTGVISRRRYNIAPPEQGKINRRLPNAFPSR
jgi:hypothetical protein